MPKPISALWHAMPVDITDRLGDALPAKPGGKIFFRADDIGVPGARFSRLLQIFAHHQVSLALAVVPVWLTTARWKTLSSLAAPDHQLWCWHQHGWRHHNHETEGRKQEFGPSRPWPQIVADITRGRQRLGTIMGPAFQPIFTPPWNRCDPRTLTALAQNGFAAVSSYRGQFSENDLPIADIPVHVDLHTRKGKNGRADWQALLSELGDGLLQPLCGIMIHHQCMNEAAFLFLDLLLGTLAQRHRSGFVSLQRLVGGHLR